MRFLIIQQKMVGDVLLSSILCDHIKIHFPNSEVHYLVNENAVPVVQGHPQIDKVVVFSTSHRKSKIAFFGFLKSISREKYDVVIDVYCKLESNLISLCCKADLKISYKKWYSSFIYSQVIERSKNDDTTLGMAIENRLELLSPLIDELKYPNLRPKIHLDPKEINAASQLLITNEVNTEKPILMIGIQGSCSSKSYPLPYLAKILDGICENFEVTLLFNYLPHQETSLIHLLKHCGEHTKKAARSDIFCPDLRSFIGLLSICDAYIGNEGGASNMAKALDIPNYSIFSPWISKTAWLTFKDNTINQGVHLEDYHPEIGKLPKKTRKKNAIILYEQLNPNYFLDHLLDFIKFQVLPNQ